MKTLQICLIFLLLWGGFRSPGQNIVFRASKQIPTGICHFTLDSMYILPSSLKLKNLSSGEIIPPHSYVFYFSSSEIVLSDSLCDKGFVLEVTYKTISIPRNFSLYHKIPDEIQPDQDTIIKYSILTEKPFQPFDSDGLNKQGIISRGISAGNTQGASLQSTLDIRLSGKLNNDVEITAVITDNNIPVQPEGNTQQLREFDKVFIELKKNNTLFRAGDVDVVSSPGYFMKYFKKIQGGALQTAVTNKSPASADSSRQTITVSAGISKGKFSRNLFEGINGNQGPYRLTGAESEMYIIILAGTERVFVNGEQMTRGQDYDYTIDYNTAELIFTANRLITSDHRIIVEFEYSDKNYVRSLISANYYFTGEKSQFRFSVFSEQDARNQPLNQILDEQDKFILQAAGDNVMSAVVPGWDSLGFSGDYVLYALRDSMGFDSVFVYSVNPDSAHYKVSFSYVGNGKGNYVQDKSIANGRVFKWMYPDGGIPRGDYEPYILLVAPKQHRMASAGLDYNITEKLTAGMEFSVSSFDPNTFSSIGNKDNAGVAGKLYIKHNSRLITNHTGKNFSLVKEINYEFVEARFKPVDRFRPVEFKREWNIADSENPSNEHLFSAGISFLKNSSTVASLKSDYFIKSGEFNGLKNQLKINLNNKTFAFRDDIFFIYGDRKSYNSSFFRQKGIFSATRRNFTAGTAFEQELNLFRETDSLFGNSGHFFELEPFLSSAADTAKIQYRIWYKNRHTQRAVSGILADAFVSDETGARIQTNFSSGNRFSLTGTYRAQSSRDTVYAPALNDKVFISHADNNLSFFDGAISSFMYYESGNGRESKKEFSYLEVQPGQGQYAWIDYNQNSIKELDEFEPANYQDEANYIRIVMPTNEYVQVYTLSFSEILSIEPTRAWKNDTLVWKKIISMFSARIQYSLNKKTMSKNISERFLPYSGDIADTTLISVNSGFNSTIFFQRAHPVFNMRYRYTENFNRAFLISGFENREIKTHEFQLVWNLAKSFGTEYILRSGNRLSQSEISFQKNFLIRFLEFSPSLNFQPSVSQRFSLIGRYKSSENISVQAGEDVTMLSAGPEFRFPLMKDHTFNLRFTWYQVTYHGSLSSPVAFEILESLEPGSNFTWNMNLRLVVSKSLQLNLMYEGRQPRGRKTIHFGNIQLKALL